MGAILLTDDGIFVADLGEYVSLIFFELLRNTDATSGLQVQRSFQIVVDSLLLVSADTSSLPFNTIHDEILLHLQAFSFALLP